jgi:hypothetical protein
MKVIVWVEIDQVEDLNRGEVVDYWEREPGIFEKVVQVTIDLDTYQRLKDATPERNLPPQPEI